MHVKEVMLYLINSEVGEQNEKEMLYVYPFVTCLWQKNNDR